MSYLINICGGGNYQRVVLRKLIELTETCHRLATAKFVQYAFHFPHSLFSFIYNTFQLRHDIQTQTTMYNRIRDPLTEIWTFGYGHFKDFTEFSI